MAPRPRRKSTAKGTKKLKSSQFAYPKTRQYPINTKKRARNALARAAQKGTSGTYAHVARAVRRKYGSTIAVGKSKPKGRSQRKRKRTTRRRKRR